MGITNLLIRLLLAFNMIQIANTLVSSTTDDMNPAANVTTSNSTSSSNSSLTATSSLLPSSTFSSHTDTLRHHGLNVVNQRPLDPTKFKTPIDWGAAFQIIDALPGHFNSVRLYSTTEGTNATETAHLQNAIFAARLWNLSINAGIWSGGDDHQARFEAEKNGLEKVLARYGCEHIIAVSVGNEDLYNNNSQAETGNPRYPLADVSLLVRQIDAVAELLDRYGCCNTLLTHADTFAEWLKPSSGPLIDAIDFVTVNIFPYWEGVSIERANETFWQHVEQVRNVTNQHDRDIWIGETGWPHSGETRDQAVASIANMQRYFREVGCSLKSMNTYYYAQWDAPSGSKPLFGLTDINGNPSIDLSCP